MDREVIAKHHISTKVKGSKDKISLMRRGEYININTVHDLLMCPRVVM